MSEEAFKCSCERCDGHIEVPVEYANMSVECPHCHESTTLTLTQTSVSEGISILTPLPVQQTTATHGLSLQSSPEKEEIGLGNRQSSSGNAFDPSYFGDPVAMQTEWTVAAERDGSISGTMQTHKPVEIHPNRLEFRPTGKTAVFLSLIIFLGLGAAIHGLLSEQWLELSIGLVIGLLAVNFLWSLGNDRIVFDKYSGQFWAGRKPTNELSKRKENQYFAKFEDIHAIQLVSEFHPAIRRTLTKEGSAAYHSYQVNLVLKNGNRLNVVNHEGFVKIREDAQVLSGFLGRPIWDAIDATRTEH